MRLEWLHREGWTASLELNGESSWQDVYTTAVEHLDNCFSIDQVPVHSGP
jgi:hypothetical protein